MLGEGEMRPQLFWGRAFPSCHNSSSRKQTQAGTASAPSHHRNMRNTHGASRVRLPSCLLPASSCSLSHAPPSIAPLQAALAGTTMASLPHGNILPEYPAFIPLPSPRNAKAWGRKTLPWGRSIPTSPACYQLGRREPDCREGEDMAVYLFCSRPQSCQCGLRGPRAEPAGAEGY